jgi:DNA-binding CsgD family transcriptional regulator
MVSTVFNSYLLVNVPEFIIIDSSLLKYQDFFERIAILLLTFTIPALIHNFFSVSYTKLKNGIIALIILLDCGISLWLELLFGNTVFAMKLKMFFIDNSLSLFDPLTEILLFILLLYSFMTGLYFYKRLQNPQRKKYAQNLLILIGISIIISLEDSFLGFVSGLDTFPLVYCGYGIVFSRYFIKYYILYKPSDSQPIEKTCQRNNFDDSMPAEAIFEQYNISPREQDVLDLILQGYTNANIAKALFISLNTVKTHIRNIFQKCEVTNRYELILLFKSNVVLS